MFGALNRFIGRLDGDGSPQNRNSTENAFGFQVLKNNDPELEVEPWFDYILGINGRQIDNPDPHLLSLEVQNCASGNLSFTVWSAKGSQFRTLSISVPSPPKLNLTLQWAPLSLTSSIWHILSVSPRSPAEGAGLLPHGDYVIGTPSGQLQGEAGLGELVEDHLNRPLELWVYNHEHNVTRLVTIVPSKNWGGEGALGCMLGFGALHQLPAALESPPQAPGEALFDTTTDRFSNEEPRYPNKTTNSSFNPPRSASIPTQDFLVPANNIMTPPLRTTSASPSKDQTVPPRAGRRKYAGHSPSKDMDDYFNEGEAKSKEEDFIPSSKGGVPPPPKADTSGPPQAKPEDEKT